MMEMLVPGLYLFVGIVLYLFLQHLLIAFDARGNRKHLIFSGLCLMAVIASMLGLSIQHGLQAAQVLSNLEFQLFALSGYVVFLFWFVALQTSSKAHKIPQILTSIFGLLWASVLVATFYVPMSLWAALTTFWFMFVLLLMGSLVFVMSCLVKQWRQHRRDTDAWMLSSMIFAVAGMLGSWWARYHAIQLAEIMTLGFSCTTVILGVALARETQLQLHVSERDFRTMFENSPTATMAIEPVTGRIVQANPVALKLFGYGTAEMLALNLTDIVFPEYGETFVRETNMPEYPSINLIHSERRYLKKDGHFFIADNYVSALKNDRGEVIRLIVNVIDITDRKQHEKHINRLAFYDQLTQLPNRQYFGEQLARILTETLKDEWYGALLLIDLDNFKTINDTMGHSVGDALLQQVAQRLSANIRGGDMVARLGGDEFVVVFPNLHRQMGVAIEQAEIRCRQILTELGKPYRLDDAPMLVTCSLGATFFRRDAVVESLVKEADIALYQAKKSGRNTMAFFALEMQEAINGRVKLEHELREALELRQFRLHYQIQVDEHKQMIGAEALIRWAHPERGMVPPAQFIPVAEEIGLILPIGRMVLEMACKQMASWKNHPMTNCQLTLAVNVSSTQLQQNDFVEHIRMLMHRYDILPGQLKLELTESALLTDMENTVRVMQELRRIGVLFSLDDFGTGYSSLQYIKRLPIDQLKIDKSFVQDIQTDQNDRTIVRTIIAMAQALNLQVIAEGVETREQRDLLLEYGCCYYQGYLFDRPQPAEKFQARWLEGRVLEITNRDKKLVL